MNGQARMGADRISATAHDGSAGNPGDATKTAAHPMRPGHPAPYDTPAHNYHTAPHEGGPGTVRGSLSAGPSLVGQGGTTL